MAEFKNVTKKYGNNTVLENFSLSLKKGSKTVIMGESGCGKTTLLRIAAGLEQPDSGEFICDEKIAVLFQEPRLLPWKTAIENVAATVAKTHQSLADKYLSAVGLENDRNKFPRQLSGGMAQRVSFARFLAFAESHSATLLLLDEPFSALDEETSATMLSVLKSFSKDKTVLLITHDKSDAKDFADKIINI